MIVKRLVYIITIMLQRVKEINVAHINSVFVVAQTGILYRHLFAKCKKRLPKYVKFNSFTHFGHKLKVPPALFYKKHRYISKKASKQIMSGRKKGSDD
jgi:hypothetical protein